MDMVQNATCLIVLLSSIVLLIGQVADISEARNRQNTGKLPTPSRTDYIYQYGDFYHAGYQRNGEHYSSP